MLLQVLANGAAVALTLLLAHATSPEGLWNRNPKRRLRGECEETSSLKR